MALEHSNNTLIGSAFDAMRDSLGGFEMREMIRNYGDAWWTEGVLAHLYEDQRRDVAPASEPDDVKRIDSMDILLMLRLVVQSWKDVFRVVMDRRAQTWARELIDTRNAWAHATGEGFTDDETNRALDTMARFMEGIDAETATEIRAYYRELVERDVVTADVPEPPSEEVESVVRPASYRSDGETLRAWRTVVAPKADVARGRFKTAEFALDLATIAKGDGSFEYQDPREFFSRTYITQGMRSLLITALKRVSVTDDDDGDPVVELKTAFGGGKTHSMLAVYHLMRNSKGCRQLPGIEEVMEEAQVPSLPDKVYVATLVGTDLNPTQAKNPPFLNGKVNTLWGEMAYQLCMQKGDPEPYSIIRSADSKSIAPGTETLVQFFNTIGPCVILMDEFIAYARNLYGADDRRLPAGTFENVLSFMQQLTEAMKRTENCMLIASLPESNRELGGEGGQIALERVEHVFGRVNTIWRAATNEEGFEIVKRRLFQEYNERLAEPIVDAFMAYYQGDSDKFPIECHDHAYRKRMLACYPIHPQVFDRLYSDWSTLANFQRTRGVLRFMATVIHNLWEANDADPLIMPGSIDFSDSRVSEEIFQYLDPAWNAIVDNDVDGDNSTPANIDKNSGRYSGPRAARRLSRAIFLGSAPSQRGEASRGLETADIRLGAAMPGVEVTVYDDALGKMRDELSYLYTTGNRYWYDTHPTLEKMARERASHYERHAVHAEIVNILRGSERSRTSGFNSVYVCPGDTLDVPDEPVLALVILPPAKSHRPDQDSSPAQAFAADCLSMRGESLRTNRNTLLFCAIDNTLLHRDVTDAVQRYLAWKSIDDEADGLELTRTARQELSTKLKASKDRAVRQVLGAYKHMLCPSQATGNLKAVEWDTLPIIGYEPVSKRAFDKAIRDEAVLTQYSPFLLDKDLKDTLMTDADHLRIGELFDDYCRYCYLRRFADQEVLRDCIVQGVASKDYFAYADGYDEEKGRFQGLVLGERPYVDMKSGLLVKREAALEQLAFEKKEPKPPVVVPGGETPGAGDKPGGGDGPTVDPEPPAKPVIRDVSIEAALDKLTAGMEVGTIVEEMLRPLYDAGGSWATLTFTADVTVPDGVDDDLLRTLRENANTLGVTLRFS